MIFYFLSAFFAGRTLVCEQVSVRKGPHIALVPFTSTKLFLVELKPDLSCVLVHNTFASRFISNVALSYDFIVTARVLLAHGLNTLVVKTTTP